LPDWGTTNASLKRIERLEHETARMLLGWCGPAKVVGDRVVEAREARVQARREAEARHAEDRKRFNKAG
jgi:hypothetical protein